MPTVNYRDAILRAAKLLGLSKTEEYLQAENAGGTVPKETEKLLFCADITAREIASDYFPLKTCERIKTKDGRIFFRDLIHDAVHIYCVKKNGMRLSFKTFHDCVAVALAGEYDIEYSYSPRQGGIDSGFEWEDGRVSAQLLAFGIACEYCLLEGNYDEAAVMDRRFKDALSGTLTPRKEVRIKQRRFI